MKKLSLLLILILYLTACDEAVTHSSPAPIQSNSPTVQVSYPPDVEISASPPVKESQVPPKDPNLNTTNTGDASPVPSISPPDDYIPVGPRDIEDAPGYRPDKPLNNPYSVNDPVQEGLTEGNVKIIFKDEYKVRYDQQKKKFISLAGADVSNINNIMDSHNTGEIGGFFYVTEEEAAEMEQVLEESSGNDVSNKLSSYWFDVKDTDLKAFIESLRAEPLVRQANHNTGVGTSY